MARGFESKDVEFQQAEAERRSARAASLPIGSAETVRDDRDRATARRSLELNIVRVRHDLTAARSVVHRRMLEQALADLERQLRATSPG